LAAQIIYRSPLLYQAIMRVLYGRHYDARNLAIANLIPPGSSVLDLCCGPGLLYERCLRQKKADYTGIDASPSFIARVNQLGARAIVSDLTRARALPRADYVVMQSSLCYFLPEPSSIIDRMLDAARTAVIISEPIRNLSTSSSAIIRQIAVKLSGPGGERPQRFTEGTLDQLFERYAESLIDKFKIPGGREKIYLLKGKAYLSQGT
jgi:trans-aconitate methyltransferase